MCGCEGTRTRRWLFVAPLAVAAVAVARSSRASGVARNAARALRKGPGPASRYLAGVGRGVAHRLATGPPSAVVDDDVLAERIRSTLGRMERHLDIPRVHVAVTAHVVSLHGDVADPDQVHAVERAVLEIPGVAGIHSYLHVGLIEGDTTPSEGAARRAPSRALLALRSAVRSEGVGDDAASRVLRSILGDLCEFLPDQTRSHLLTHLPGDVRVLAQPARRTSRRERARSADEFATHVAAASGVDSPTAARAARAVFRALRELVPEEAAPVAAVLPQAMRREWAGAASR